MTSLMEGRLAPRARLLGVANHSRRGGNRALVALALVGLALFGGVSIFALELNDAQRGNERGAERRFSERARITAALTESLFVALNTAAQEQLALTYGGSPRLVRRVLSAQMRRGPNGVYSALLDDRGRMLVGVGDLPQQMVWRPDAPTISSVVQSKAGPFVNNSMSFNSPTGRRVLVLGLPLPALRSFLDKYLSRLPNPDGAALVITDEHGAVLTRTGPRGSAAPSGSLLTTKAALPGTTWRLRMTAERARVLAGVNSSAWLTWALLGVLALAFGVGLWLCVRVLLSARRVHGANAALRDSEGKLRGLVGELEQAVFVCYADGQIELLNPSAKRLLGTVDGVLTRPIPGWAALSADGYPIDEEELPAALALRTGEPQRQVIGLQQPDTPLIWLEVSARPLTHPGESWPYAAVCSCSDVSDRHELEAHLTDLADRDPLTGLWNRRRFEQDVAQQLARCERYDERAAVLLLDVDGFKQINDRLGHLTGDDVLRSIGEILGTRLRTSDCAARFGGDEFAVLLLDVTRDDAEQVASELTSKLVDAARQLTERVPVSISAGIATIDRRTGSVGEALGAADRAMYDIKEGRSPQDPTRALVDEPWPSPSTTASLSMLTVLREITGADVAWLAHETPDGELVAAVTGPENGLGIVAGQHFRDGAVPSRECSTARVPIVDAGGAQRGSLGFARRASQMQFGARERVLAEALALVAAGQLQHDELVRADTELASLRALLAAVNARDSYTALHSRQVVTLARAVARGLGLDDAQVNEVEHVALLHDLGKIAVPDAVLRKPGPLSDTEKALMRRHPVVGAEILASTPELAYLAPAVRAEHERWDGDGYPHGLAAEAIPVASRITFVCDAYNAMTNNRPYRRAMSPDAARAEIARESGTQFCPSCAEALLAVLGSELALAGT